MAKTNNPEDQQETGLAQVPENGFLGMMASGQDEPIEVLRDEEGRAVGVEVENDMLQVPRLSLVQKQSRVTDERLASPGDLLSTMAMQVLWPLPQHRVAGDVPPQMQGFMVPGMEPPTMALPFLPLKVFVDRVHFNDKMELICRSIPYGKRALQGFRSPEWQEGDLWDACSCDACPCKDWGADGEKPKCSLTYNVIGFALNTNANDPEEVLGLPLAVSMANSSASTGKAIATTLKMTNKNPWSYLWLLWSSKETKNSNVYYVWRARQAQIPGTAKAVPTPAPLADLAASIYMSLSDRVLDIDRTTAAAAEGEMAGGPLGDNEDPFGDQ